MTPGMERAIPRAFVWRRLHSLMGLWLVIFLIEHFVTNSQATLWLGDDGIGFVRLVNLYHDLPYMQVIEIALLAFPIALHGIMGVRYIFTAKSNSLPTDGSKPSMRKGRSFAYTLQRYTAWILLVGIILHVLQMRFLDNPKKVVVEDQKEYLVKLNFDSGLNTLAPRLHVDLLDSQEIANLQRKRPLLSSGQTDAAAEEQQVYQYQNWVSELNDFHLKKNQVIAISKSPGTAVLLTTRDTFKSPLMCILYTIFVLAAGFHACNGFWTFLITWGALLSMKSQRSFVHICTGFMVVMLFLGLIAIWGSYWVNLRQ